MFDANGVPQERFAAAQEEPSMQVHAVIAIRQQVNLAACDACRHMLVAATASLAQSHISMLLCSSGKHSSSSAPLCILTTTCVVACHVPNCCRWTCQHVRCSARCGSCIQCQHSYRSAQPWTSCTCCWANLAALKSHMQLTWHPSWRAQQVCAAGCACMCAVLQHACVTYPWLALDYRQPRKLLKCRDNFCKSNELVAP